MLSDPADFSIRHALIWFQGRPVVCCSVCRRARYAAGAAVAASVALGAAA